MADTDPTPETLALLRQFAGFLTTDLPELHPVEVPRLEKSLERFLVAIKKAPHHG